MRSVGKESATASRPPARSAFPSINGRRVDDDIRGFDQVALSADGRRTFSLETDPEHIDHRASALKNNPLSGITTFRLLRLLYIKRRSIDWWRYRYRISCLLAMSLLNTLLEAIEFLYMNCLIIWNNKEEDVDWQDPIFVLGHPRSGTTLLHSLLALDDSRFAICSTFCAGFPHCFLWFEHIGKFLFGSILSKTRPMDSVKLHFDLPQEDELATCLLTGGRFSPYMSMYFMRDEREYRPYQTLRTDDSFLGNSDQVAPPEDVKQWTRAFRYLCRKLQLRWSIKKGMMMSLLSTTEQLQENMNSPFSLLIRHHQPRLVLKSPCHTGRVRHLLQLYPNAKFVLVHRHPEEVFWSSVHMANTTYGYCFLQQPTTISANSTDDAILKEYILRQGEILMGEYLSCVDDGLLVKGENWAEISFDELTSKPVETLTSVYQQLNLDEKDETQQQVLVDYCKSLKGFRVNRFEPSAEEKQSVLGEVRRRWKPWYDRWNYKPLD